jgi:transposase-like protein
MEIKQRKNIQIHTNDIIERNKMLEKNKRSNCPKCGSMNSLRHGIRRCIGFNVQRFKCIDCSKYFCERPDAYLKLKKRDDIIEKALQLFQKGYSSRQIIDRLEISVKHTSVINWIKRLDRNPKFQKNASDRQEVRDKISLTLRGK